MTITKGLMAYNCKQNVLSMLLNIDNFKQRISLTTASVKYIILFKTLMCSVRLIWVNEVIGSFCVSLWPILIKPLIKMCC